MFMEKFFQNRIVAVCCAVLCTLLWGTAFPFIKLGYDAFCIADGDVGAKLLFAGSRFFIAGLMVLLVSAFGGSRSPAPSWRGFAPLLLLGLVQTAAQYLFTYIGIGFTTGANTSIITACASFLTVLSAPLFFRGDRLTWLKILGCAVGFCGVFAVNPGGGISGDTLFGDGMIFLSTVCAAAGNLLSKKIAAGRNPLTVTAVQLLFGGLLLAAAGLLVGGRMDASNLRGMLILLWLAFVSAAAFALWTTLLKYHPASRITVFNLLVPVFGTALSGVLLGEKVFRWETLVSLLLITAGIALVNIQGTSKERR